MGAAYLNAPQLLSGTDPVVQHQVASCEGKMAFATRQDAERKMATMGYHRAKPVEAYRCRFCRQWHVGNKMRAALRG